MIRRFLSMAISALFLLWLVGWFLAVGPHGAWTDISHLATRVYAWVHSNAPSVNGPIKAPSTATPTS